MADNSNVASERVLEKFRLIRRAEEAADSKAASTRATPACWFEYSMCTKLVMMFPFVNIQRETALDEVILGLLLILFKFIFMIVVIHRSDKLVYAFNNPTQTLQITQFPDA